MFLTRQPPLTLGSPRLEVALEASRLDLAGLHGEIITFKLQQPGILLPVNDWRDSAVMEGTLNTGTVWIPFIS